MCLKLCFSARGDLAMSGRGCCWHLVGTDQGCCSTASGQNISGAARGETCSLGLFKTLTNNVLLFLSLVQCPRAKEKGTPLQNLHCSGSFTLKNIYIYKTMVKAWNLESSPSPCPWECGARHPQGCGCDRLSWKCPANSVGRSFQPNKRSPWYLHQAATPSVLTGLAIAVAF